VILYRYILRELLHSFFGVTAVLFLIFLGGLLVRFLPDVSSGIVPIDKFLPIIGVRILEELVVGIPFAFFLALVVSIGKLLSESELIAAYACGFQRSKLMVVVLILAITLAMLVGTVSIILAPLADQRYQEIRAEIEQSSEINSIVSGRFIELSGGGLFYAEGGEHATGFRNISIFNSSTTEYSVINSKTLAEGEGMLGRKPFIFRNGIKTRLLKDTQEVEQSLFSEYGTHLDTKMITPSHSIYAVPATVLWASRNPAHVAELQWRIATPLMMIVLAVVAVSISRYEPRAGKYGRLFVAIVIYMIYSQLIMSSKVAIAHQDIPSVLGMWWVHLSVMAVFAGLFVYQEQRAG
jgi:lipopolysaccharide export system permease protein